MKRMLIGVLIGLMLTGCSPDTPPDPKTVYLNTIWREQLTEDYLFEACINGVVYYNRSVGHNTWFAPAFDKNTKQVRLCD